MGIMGMRAWNVPGPGMGETVWLKECPCSVLIVVLVETVYIMRDPKPGMGDTPLPHSNRICMRDLSPDMGEELLPQSQCQ